MRVNLFGLYIEANKENCGLEGQIQVVYINSMAILLKENIKDYALAGFPENEHAVFAVFPMLRCVSPRTLPNSNKKFAGTGDHSVDLSIQSSNIFVKD